MLSEDGSTVQILGSYEHAASGRVLQLRYSNPAMLHFCPQLDLLGLTCLLSAPSGGQGPGPVPCGVEGDHADHVGGVTCQVLQFHPELGQEQRPQALRLISELILPEIHLERRNDMSAALERLGMGKKGA